MVNIKYMAKNKILKPRDSMKIEANKLKKWGFKAYTEKAGDKVRVRVGPYAEREKAEKISQQLEKRGLNPVVMSVR